MLTKPSKISVDMSQGHILTEKEDLEMKENLARENFGMSLEEFAEAWKSGKFDNDRKRHSAVVGLAMMLPEYWAD